MLWCLIFHSAELQNYVPALHGIMFGSFNFNIKHHNIICFLNLTLITLHTSWPVGSVGRALHRYRSWVQIPYKIFCMTAFRKKFARKKISGNLRCRYCLDPYELCGMIHWGRCDKIAIWRVFKYLSAEYRRKLSDDISTECWAILGPYSVSKSTDSRPTLVRQVIQVGRPLVDTLSVCRSTLDRNLDRYVAFNSRSISVECRWVVHHCTVSGIISH